MFTGPQIKAIRVALGLTQAEFAARFGDGTTKSAVCLWEKDQRHPPFAKMQKLNELAREAEEAGGLVLSA